MQYLEAPKNIFDAFKIINDICSQYEILIPYKFTHQDFENPDHKQLILKYHDLVKNDIAKNGLYRGELGGDYSQEYFCALDKIKSTMDKFIVTNKTSNISTHNIDIIFKHDLKHKTTKFKSHEPTHKKPRIKHDTKKEKKSSKTKHRRKSPKPYHKSKSLKTKK